MLAPSSAARRGAGGSCLPALGQSERMASDLQAARKRSPCLALPTPPHPPTLPPHTSQQGRGLRNVCGLEAQPLPKSALGPNGRPASQGPLNGSHRDSGQAGLPSPGAWPTWEAPDPTAEGPRLPPEAWDGHSIYTHRAKTDVPEGVPASPHHPLGAPQKALGASEPIPTGPWLHTAHSTSLPAPYHADENVVLGTQATAPHQFVEQLLPKLPLEQDGTAQEGELCLLQCRERERGVVALSIATVLRDGFCWEGCLDRGAPPDQRSLTNTRPMKSGGLCTGW